MKKKLFLRKETVALLDGEKAVVYGGERYSMACATHNNVPPNCPMTSWCVETDLCMISRNDYMCDTGGLEKVTNDLKCGVSYGCIESRFCLNPETGNETAGR